MSFKIKAIKVFLRIVSLFKGDKYRYSQVYEDNFRYMETEEKLWWGYKALIKQIERAEKGKGIEEYFSNQNLNFKPEREFVPESTVTITAGGDLSSTDVVYPDSTKHLWDDIEDFFFSGDIACANLETPIDTTKPYTGVPSMCLSAPALNNSPEMFEIFARGGKGVNFFPTANNHSLDMGEDGLKATLDFLDSKGYKHTGTSRTREEQMDIQIIEKNGIRIAFLSYTYCLNGNEPIKGKEYMTNMIRLNRAGTDISLIKEHVKAAHDKRADIIVAVTHWSIEFETYPIQDVIDMGHRIIECGVDIILGGHPHVAQPMEKYCFIDPYTKLNKDGFIVYSLGELVSLNAFSKNSRLLQILKLYITKGKTGDSVVTQITDLKVMPACIYLNKSENGDYDYRLLNLRKTIRNIENGKNPYNYNDKQLKELRRLEKLYYDRLLPKDHKELLAD